MRSQPPGCRGAPLGEARRDVGVMATLKPIKTHQVEILREVYTLKTTEQRLRGIVEGLRYMGDSSHSTFSGLRMVLRDSIAAEAKSLAQMAERLNSLLGPAAADLNGGA